MPSLLDSSWLIPLVPMGGAFLVLTLLYSFNRTMNRLTKPVSFVLINCIGLSTFLCSLFFFKHYSGISNSQNLSLVNKFLELNLALNSDSELSVIVLGLIFIVLMLFSYYRLPRAKGYVAYMSLLSLLCGIIFFVALSADANGNLLYRSLMS